MFSRITNVVIAVKNLEEATKQYTDNFDMPVSHSGTVPQLGINNAYFDLGEATLELMEPLNPQEGPIARFLEQRGEGIYMIDLEVETIDSAVQSLSTKGVRLIGGDAESRAKGGRVFIHPQATRGVLVGLHEKEA